LSIFHAFSALFFTFLGPPNLLIKIRKNLKKFTVYPEEKDNRILPSNGYFFLSTNLPPLRPFCSFLLFFSLTCPKLADRNQDKPENFSKVQSFALIQKRK
jgi:hypothetical protein